MKQRDLVKELKKLGFRLCRQGGNHEVYRFNEVSIPVPRHREVNELTAKGILKQARLAAKKAR